MSLTQNEKRVIDLLKKGDQTAFRKVFDLHYKQLVITSYQVLKDEEICRDAVQEVYLELWKNRGKLHYGIHLSSYLRRSVINRSINILKSRRHHMSSGAEPLNYVKDVKRDPAQEMEDEEFRRVVHRAIDRLPDRCRAVFMLCKMEGYSHKEVSARLGISTKTIENQITKAVKSIRSEIHRYQQSILSSLGILLILWGNYMFELFIKPLIHLG